MNAIVQGIFDTELSILTLANGKSFKVKQSLLHLDVDSRLELLTNKVRSLGLISENAEIAEL